MSEAGPGPKKREDALARLTEGGFHLLVAGGGVTGAGIALDAATRGLSVALIEAEDFASGTSSKSSKLIHGGLRYLEHRELGLMREAATERDRLRRLAPHLVRPIPFLFPVWAGGRRKAGVGLTMYDALAGFGAFERHRRVDAEEAGRLVPGTSRTGGGYVYFDAQTDDARLTMALISAARRAGAVVCNHLRVDGFLVTTGSVGGAVATDGLSGQSLEIQANDVVNATGVWADDLRLMESEAADPMLRPSKGVHILMSRETLPLESACLLPAGERRMAFAVPWRSSVLVGTTDTDYRGALDAPSVTEEEVSYLLRALARNFERTFSPADVTGAYAGLRPLLAHAETEATRDLSRRHAIFRGDAGVVTITGGKLTTYRLMAEEVVDLITRRQGRPTRSMTASLRLGVSDPAKAQQELALRLRDLGLGEEVASSLLFSYGDDAPSVLDLAVETGTAGPVQVGLPYLLGEIVWGVREEMAQTVEDLMSRRMRLGLEDRGAGVGGAESREVLASELGAEGARHGIDRYLDRVTAERGPGLGMGMVRS